MFFECKIVYITKRCYGPLTRKCYILQLARETLTFWVRAFSEDTAKRLENFGFIQFRPGGTFLDWKCIW